MFSIRTLQSWVELVSILLLIQAIRPAKSMPGFAAQCPVLSRNVLRAACLQPLAVRPSETDDVFGMVIEVDDMLPWSVKGRAPSEARFGADPRAAFTPPPENPPKPSRRPSLSPLLPSAAFIPPPDEKTLKPTKRLARNRSFSPVSPPPPRTASVSPEGNTLRYPLGVPRLVKRQRGGNSESTVPAIVRTPSIDVSAEQDTYPLRRNPSTRTGEFSMNGFRQSRRSGLSELGEEIHAEEAWRIQETETQEAWQLEEKERGVNMGDV